MNLMFKTVLINVSGRVQGVFYRQSTREKAVALNITGKIKNLPDENVEIIATGNKEQLEKLVDWCRQGPPKAQVRNLIVKEIDVQHFDIFSIEYS